MNCFPEAGCSPARETQVEVGFPNAISPPEKKTTWNGSTIYFVWLFPTVGVLMLMVQHPQLPSNHTDSA